MPTCPWHPLQVGLRDVENEQYCLRVNEELHMRGVPAGPDMIKSLLLYLSAKRTPEMDREDVRQYLMMAADIAYKTSWRFPDEQVGAFHVSTPYPSLPWYPIFSHPNPSQPNPSRPITPHRTPSHPIASHRLPTNARFALHRVVSHYSSPSPILSCQGSSSTVTGHNALWVPPRRRLLDPPLP